MNLNLAQSVLDSVFEAGVRTLAVCPGARNSPFIEILKSDSRFQKFHFFDERSAAFFCLGEMQITKSPAAVITTSGTAVGELLPAVMEAYYSCLPLVLITADRPERYRGTGAPQSAEQIGIFGIYAEQTSNPNLNKPWHINVSFDEPLPGSWSEDNGLKVDFTKIEKKQKFEAKFPNPEVLNFFLKEHKNILVLVGGLSPDEARGVFKFLKHTKLPFYAEGPSQLRESEELSESRVENLDRFLERSKNVNWNVDGILRIGDVPTHRFWRDLDIKFFLPTLSLSRKPFSGSPASALIHSYNPEFFEVLLTEFVYQSEYFLKFKKEELERGKNLIKLFEKFPDSEPAIFHKLSQMIPSRSRVYLGNSLPVREWDLAATRSDRQIYCHGSRGLNGIDGQISTFLGGTQVYDGPSWAIVGDLTALYDLQAPWILSQMDLERNKQNPFKIVIINNSGGRIFERIFKSNKYTNEHSIHFKHWAQMWGLNYIKNDTVKLDLSAQIIEIIPQNSATENFWNAYEEI